MKCFLFFLICSLLSNALGYKRNYNEDLGNDCCPLVFEDLTSTSNEPANAIIGGHRLKDKAPLYYVGIENLDIPDIDTYLGKWVGTKVGGALNRPYVLQR